MKNIQSSTPDIHHNLPQKITLCGTGLIGCSWTKAIKHALPDVRVTGFDINNIAGAQAIKNHAIDCFQPDLQKAVTDADLVILAAPLLSIIDLMRSIAPAISNDTIITDVGSAKNIVIKEAQHHLANHLDRLVPGHPVSGKENSGACHANPALFKDRLTVLTPLPEKTKPSALACVSYLWEITGAKVVCMNAKKHDHIFASVSHLPHMLAYLLVDYLAHKPDADEIFQYVAGGFSDFTRIASSDPKMWHDITLANDEALLIQLDAFRQHLTHVIKLVKEQDGPALENLFRRAKTKRDSYLNELKQ